MSKTIAKFKVTNIEPYPNTPEGEATSGFKVIMEPVTSGSLENENFFKWTPYGKIEMGIVNPACASTFEVGKEVLVTFNPHTDEKE
jgi:hypothetical protein